MLKDIEITFNASDRTLTLAKDIRHGIEGYRAIQHTIEEDGWGQWDSHYMFYTTLDEAYIAFINQDFEKGRNNF